jgi:hypothetical protein
LGIKKKRGKMCSDWVHTWRKVRLSKLLLQHLQCALWTSGLFLSQAWYCGCSSHLFRNLHFPGILNWQWSRTRKNDGKIFKTLGKNWINCGNRGNYRKCFKNIFLIVKIKDVGKRSPHHYCCIINSWHYIT